MSSYLDQITPAALLDLYEQAVSSIEEVCSQLDPADWDRPTDNPGWSVKDNLAHLAHYESLAVDRPQPPEVALLEEIPHVRNEFGRLNEAGVAARRPQPGPGILEDFRDATTQRLKDLAALAPEAWNEGKLRTPFGESPLIGFMPIRLLDLLYHEQDIRRATGRPGHLQGAVARFAFERMAAVALPRVVAKEAGAPEGSVVAFDVDPPGRSFAIEVRDGRGATIDAPGEATARMAADFEAFLLLMGGRRSPEQLRADGRLTTAGDDALAGRVLDAIVVVP